MMSPVLKRLFGYVLRGLKWLFIVISAVTVCVLAALYVFANPGVRPSGEAHQKVLLTGLNIVGVDDGSIRYDQAILIKDGIIEGIGATSTFLAPADTSIIDLSGLYAVPGLWNMHAHLDSPGNENTTMPAMVANGVLYAREMWGDCSGKECVFRRSFEENSALYARVERGELVGPYVTSIGSFGVHGAYEAYEKNRRARTPAYLAPMTAKQGRALARALQKKGLDFIKPYDTIPREAYFAMMEEARLIGMRVGGHVPKGVTLEEAIQAGQMSVEHGRMLPVACSPYDTGFAAVYAKLAALSGHEHAAFKANHNDWRLTTYYKRIINEQDDEKCDAVLKLWADAGSYYVPTHITRFSDAIIADEPYLNDPRSKVVPDILLKLVWSEQARTFAKKIAAQPGLEQDFLDFFNLGVALTVRANEAGVNVMIGTDVSDTLVYPGYSMHDEMLYLYDAGMPALDVLRSATLTAAEYEGMTETHGTIAVGKNAALVFLKDNPLEDLAAIRNQYGVFHQGYFYDAEGRDRLLDAAQWHAKGFGQILSSGWFMLTGPIPYILQYGMEGDTRRAPPRFSLKKAP